MSAGIALQQSVRLLLLIVALPMAISAFGLDLGLPPVPTMSARDLGLVAVCGVPAALLLHRLGVPGGMMNGAFLASALLHRQRVRQLVDGVADRRLYRAVEQCRIAALRHRPARSALRPRPFARRLRARQWRALIAVGVVVALLKLILAGPALLALPPAGWRR